MPLLLLPTVISTRGRVIGEASCASVALPLSPDELECLEGSDHCILLYCTLLVYCNILSLYIMVVTLKRLKTLFNFLLLLQLKSNPSENEEKEAQSQLIKSDEMQHLRSQALDAFESSDYIAAITFLDKVLEVSFFLLLQLTCLTLTAFYYKVCVYTLTCYIPQKTQIA